MALSAPAIDVRSLSYSYADGRRALSAVTLAVAPGEHVGIVGPNGAGKSTLLLHLNGLLPDTPPAEPRVWIDGTPVATATLDRVRRAVGLLFQDPDDQVISATVYEDVAFGPRQLGLDGAALDARVASSLAQVGLSGFEGREPHRLSHGEKRRVCLAGVLACEPATLALDEPTADLDPRARREFIALMAALPMAKIMATHDLELVVSTCTRVIVLDEGRIVAAGPTVEVMSDEALMLAHGLERPHSLT
jgi:energy-coupling factor transporter ATP-binding protein EcfA2